MESIGKKIVRNTIYNSIGRIWLMLVTLLLIPYILHKLGVQVFAVWSLVFVVANCMGLLDFGIRTSFAKYIAEYHTKKDQKSINAVINCGIIFYLVFSLFVIGLAVVLRGPIISLLKIPPPIHAESMFAILGMVLILCLNNTLSIFEAVLVGLQRMDVRNKILIFASFFNVAGTFFFLEKGFGLRGLVINYGIVSFVIILLNLYFSYRLLPHLRIGWSRVKKEIFRKLFNYGVKMQICNFAAMIHLQADKIILSHFLGLNFVTFYELGQKAANAVRTFPMLLLTALVPAVSELEASDDKGKLRELYERGSKYVSLAVFPLIFLSIIVAPDLINLWVGDKFSLAILSFQVLVIGYGINVLTGMGTSMVRGIGKPEYEARYAVLTLIMQLTLSITLVQIFGFRGILASVLITSVVAALYFLLTFHRLLKQDFKSFARATYVKPVVASLVAFAITFGLSYYLPSLIFLQGRLGYSISLLLKSVIFLVFFILLIVRIRFLDVSDVRLFKLYLRPQFMSKI
ncbi:MAG: oligosaccharide flippase family protein [candidate division Zixibacteria bacterium]|nr:oligosaccharide flippase family protein [candidate division Zixibacteria bacterium]